MAHTGGENGGSNSAPPQNTALQAQYALLAAWDAAHPLPASPVLAPEDRAWSRARFGFMAQIGLLSETQADGFSDYMDWHAFNRRRDHPELSDAQYDQLTLSMFEYYVITNMGGHS